MQGRPPLRIFRACSTRDPFDQELYSAAANCVKRLSGRAGGRIYIERRNPAKVARHGYSAPPFVIASEA